MIYTRRAFMGISLGSAITLSAERVLGQGVAAHAAKPLARQAPSGRPFNAHFVDVGAAAGLHSPTIYGGVESKKYILESTGCGCAFIDYDNDGWMDIFLLSGTRLGDAAPETTNRLYKNNRVSRWQAGRPGFASETTTTTVLRTSSVPTLDKIASIVITATADSPM